MIDDLHSTHLGPLDNLCYLLFCQQFCDRNPGHISQPDHGQHLISMNTHDQGIDIGRCNSNGIGQKCSVTGCIKNSCHADNPALIKSGYLERGMDHGVNGIGDYNHKTIRRVLDRLLSTGFDNGHVFCQQIITGHAGFTGQACGDYNHV